MPEKMNVEQAFARLRAALNELPWRDHEAEIAIATIRAEIARLEKDAERYRWLRENCFNNPSLRAQLRAWAAEEMRGLVPDEIPEPRTYAALAQADKEGRIPAIIGHNECRAETLSNIERWEKSHD